MLLGEVSEVLSCSTSICSCCNGGGHGLEFPLMWSATGGVLMAERGGHVHVYARAGFPRIGTASNCEYIAGTGRWSYVLGTVSFVYVFDRIWWGTRV